MLNYELKITLKNARVLIYFGTDAYSLIQSYKL